MNIQRKGRNDLQLSSAATTIQPLFEGNNDNVPVLAYSVPNMFEKSKPNFSSLSASIQPNNHVVPNDVPVVPVMTTWHELVIKRLDKLEQLTEQQRNEAEAEMEPDAKSVTTTTLQELVIKRLDKLEQLMQQRNEAEAVLIWGTTTADDDIDNEETDDSNKFKIIKTHLKAVLDEQERQRNGAAKSVSDPERLRSVSMHLSQTGYQDKAGNMSLAPKINRKSVHFGQCYSRHYLKQYLGIDGNIDDNTYELYWYYRDYESIDVDEFEFESNRCQNKNNHL